MSAGEHDEKKSVSTEIAYIKLANDLEFEEDEISCDEREAQLSNE